MKLTFSNLKMDGWKMILSFWGVGGPVFRGEIAVSFREGRVLKIFKYHVGLPQGYHFY